MTGSDPGDGGGGTAVGEVRAAGGVVLRPGADGRTEVLVVHRPKYDDWSLPKGKLDPGERPVDAAVREVEEETGYRCRVGDELTSVRYSDRRGRHKVVRYWVMTPVSGSFRPNAEVDQARWLPVDEAVELLSYERDQRLVAAVDGLRP